MARRATQVKAVIAVAAIVIAGYFALGLAGALPPQYDLVRQYFTPSANNNTTVQTSDNGEIQWNGVQVSGTPNVVNLSVAGENSYTLTFRCVEGTMQYMNVDVRVMLTNATVTLEGNHRWRIMEDARTATYIGAELVLYQTTSTLTLHVDGDSTTTGGYVVLEFNAPRTYIEAEQLQITVEA